MNAVKYFEKNIYRKKEMKFQIINNIYKYIHCTVIYVGIYPFTMKIFSAHLRG